MGVQELLIVELVALNAEECVDRIIGLQLQEVLHGATLRILCLLRYLKAAQPIDAALLGEEEYHVVSICGIYELREVLLSCSCATGSYAATRLRTEV